MNKTSIEWTDYTWNPVTGCDKISAGCRSCYAETLANRFWGDRKFTDVQMHEDRLIELRKSFKKLNGKKVFVCDVSDLFHDDVSFEFIAKIFHEFYYLPNTTFQILTKRPQRALEFFKWASPVFFDKKFSQQYIVQQNIWIGVSCENQEQADKRIPLLMQIPAAVRFLSCEPLIGPIDLDKYLPIMEPATGNRELGWVIAGGESGGKLARPMHPEWVRSLRDQCAAANVPFFFKQWGEWRPGSEYGEGTISLNPDKKHHLFNDLTGMYRVGKSKAGNLLDGKQHLNFPI